MREYTGGAHLRRILRENTGKAPFGRVTVQGSGEMAVVTVRTVRPDHFESRRDPELVPELERALDRSVTVQVTPEARAVHKYVRVSPTKARRVMDEIRGRYVDEALALVQFLPNKAARYIHKLLRSAAANAFEGFGAEPHELKISLLTADPGPTAKRIRPRAQGRAYRILKRTSHLTVAVEAAPPRAAIRRGPRRGGQASVTRA